MLRICYEKGGHTWLFETDSYVGLIGALNDLVGRGQHDFDVVDAACVLSLASAKESI